MGRGFGCSGFRTSASSIYACEGYRLPTDAEREYATRAGTRTAFYNGEITQQETMDCMADAALQKIAWYCFNSQGHTHPVGQLEANGWGLVDMAGNAMEWVSDASTGLPSDGATDPGATLKMLPANRVTRGGIFNGPAQYCRAAWQSSAAPGSRGPGLGFRLVRTLHD